MANSALAQPYHPVGVQTDVPMSAVTNGGWSECYSDLYVNDGIPLSSILAGCNAEDLMLACNPVGDTEFTVLAQASYSDVTFDVGQGNTTHTANDVEWYFDNQDSWGFAPLGASVSRTSCDTSGTDPEQRLCWHTGNGEIDGGWRCGATTSLNSSTDWERHIFIRGAVAPMAPVPASNNYALALLVLILGSVGFVAVRRYR